ncbi:MAG: hypothetical protein NTX45_22535 [Proteobacteria bacterium]|nr:hypothetical protein [Pseudomonadota bacterium]
MKQVLVLFVTAILLSISLCKALADGDLNKSPPLHLINNTSYLDVVINRNIIHFTDSDSSRSLKQRIDSLQTLLNTYFSDHPRELKYSFTFGPYAELNARMASLASCSQQWDFRSGQIKKGNTATWLRELLNQELAFHELIPVFEAIGYQIEIASLESISLCHSKEIDWVNTPRSCQRSISRQVKLPCGALLTFSLNSTR